MKKKIGSALVVGGGMSGIRSALDLAETGYLVTLIDRAPHLGGTLMQLDYQFPTDHCGMCRMLPLVERDASSQYCLRKGLFHENIEIMTATELVGLEGEPGRFQATLRRRSTLVDTDRCIGCGECSQVCPVDVPDAFNAGLTTRKAVYLPVPHNIPNTYVVDTVSCTFCGECEKVCPTGAIDLQLEVRRGFRILVVDDELIVRDSIKEWLEEEGFSVDMAESGSEALERLAAEHYDLMLLDVKMPGMDGVEVLKQAMEMRDDLPVVMMTAYATVETAVEAMKIGARDYLVKPFDPEALINMTHGFFQATQPRGEIQLEVGAVVLATGFRSYDPSDSAGYGYSDHHNVLTSIEFERLLSGTGPYEGRLNRPSDGKPIRKAAWIQCVGSRNRQMEADFCSSACCMFSIKEAVRAKERSGGEIDTAIFYMDMRTYGRDFQRYRDRAEQEHGVRFERSRVHSVETADPEGGLRISFIRTDGSAHEENFDVVVLAAGQRPPAGTDSLAEMMDLELNRWGFCEAKGTAQTRSSRPGVFASGSTTGLRDISESVIQAGSASLAASALIHSKGGGLAEVTGKEEAPAAYRDVSRELPRMELVLCNCGGDLAEAARFDMLAAELAERGSVERVLRIDRVCTREGWSQLEEALRQGRTNRVLIGACLPYVYSRKLRALGKAVGLDPALMDVVDLRTLAFPWRDTEAGTAVREVRAALTMGMARLEQMDPVALRSTEVIQTALVVGGGIAGMSAALAIADHGFGVTLVERESELGGNLRQLHRFLDGSSPGELLAETIARVEKHPHIEVLTGARVLHSDGEVGRFATIIETGSGDRIFLDHGVTVLATGGREAATRSYGYGESEAVVTQHELEQKLADGELDPLKLGTVLMIQCVDSREEPRNYCSRVCCSSTLKNALFIREHNPEADVYVCYRDLMSYGFLEAHYTQAREARVLFIPYGIDRKPQVSIEDGKPRVAVVDPILDRELLMEPDLVVLATGISPDGQQDLARIFGVETTVDGFFQEADSKWRPVDCLKEGVFLCGIAHSPRSVPESVAMAEAAAQRALRILSREQLTAGTVVAEVRHSLCSLCERCIEACPYGARWIDEQDDRVVVTELKCQGCGSCAAVCPNSATVLRGLCDRQVFSVIDAALEGPF